jgi:hypothetical protein
MRVRVLTASAIGVRLLLTRLCVLRRLLRLLCLLRALCLRR